MSSWATSNASFAVTTNKVRNVHTKFDHFTVANVKPNTKYSITLNGVDYGWASKPLGGDLGGDLVSNSNGILEFFMLREIPIFGRLVIDNIVPEDSSEEKKGARDIITEYTLIELRAGGSYFPIRLDERSIVRGAK